MDRSYVTENDAERARLKAIVARLMDADLARVMREDRTVGVGLMHLAFSDGLPLSKFEAWERTAAYSRVVATAVRTPSLSCEERQSIDAVRGRPASPKPVVRRGLRGRGCCEEERRTSHEGLKVSCGLHIQAE